MASDDATSVTAGALGMAVAILFLRHQEERDNMLAKCDSPQENVGLDQNLIKIEGDINDLYSLGEVLGEGMLVTTGGARAPKCQRMVLCCPQVGSGKCTRHGARKMALTWQ